MKKVIYLMFLFIFVFTIKQIMAEEIDVESPVITLLGNNPEIVEEGTIYTDAGAVATDNYDGDLTFTIVVTDNINTNVAGTYQSIYFVVDSSGNSAEATRTVMIAEESSIIDLVLSWLTSFFE